MLTIQKLTSLILSITLLFAACQPRLLSRVSQYALSNERYAVVSSQEPGMSAEETRQAAYVSAAQLTASKGYRFFVVDEEKPVRLVESSGQNPMPGNLYQELIIEKGSGQSEPLLTQSVPGIRLVIRLVRDEKSGKAIDACRYTKCQ
jgi:hypothetical protein